MKQPFFSTLIFIIFCSVQSIGRVSALFGPETGSHQSSHHQVSIITDGILELKKAIALHLMVLVN